MPGGGTLTVTRRGATGRRRGAVASPTPASAWTTRRRAASSSRTSRPRPRGTGLGLSIARRNVELHGGTIAVAVDAGVGTDGDDRAAAHAAGGVTVSPPIDSAIGGVTERRCGAASRPRRPAGASAPRRRSATACRARGGASAAPRPADQAGRQIAVGHHDQRDLRVRGDRRDDQRHQQQAAVGAPRAEVDRLEAAVADGADHQERRHQHHRQRQQRCTASRRRPYGIGEDRRRGHAGRGRARHADEVALVRRPGRVWMLKRASRIAAAETNTKPAAQPSRPNGCRPQANAQDRRRHAERDRRRRASRTRRRTRSTCRSCARRGRRACRARWRSR